MSNNKYLQFFPLKKLMSKSRLSERSLSEEAGISRVALRKLIFADENINITTVSCAAEFFDLETSLVVAKKSFSPDSSILSVSYLVDRDGFSSWKIHFMNFVDEFKKTLNPYLILLPPHTNFDKKLTALLASMVRHLCEESGMSVPHWALKRYYLDTPWFPSEMQTLKASALLESPTAFRNNNIYVHSNFFERA